MKQENRALSMTNLLVTILWLDLSPERYLLKLPKLSANFLSGKIIRAAGETLHKNDCWVIVGLAAVLSKITQFKSPNILAAKSQRHLLNNNHWRVQLHSKMTAKLVLAKEVLQVAHIALPRKNLLETFVMTMKRAMMISLLWIQFYWLKSRHMLFKPTVIHQ